MNVPFLTGLAVLVPVLCASICVAAEHQQKEQKCTIVVFGDSTTAARGKIEIYANWLERELPAKGIRAEIINAGIGGHDTQMAVARFQRDVLAKDPDLVVIQFGINDSAVDVSKNPPATKPRVAKETYMRNLEKLVETLKARKCGVILMTPNQMCWTKWLKENNNKPPYDINDPDGFNINLREYAQAVREIAEKQKVPLVDVYAAFSAYGKIEKQSVNDLLMDGMHPNDKGQRMVADLLIPEIVKLCKAKTE